MKIGLITLSASDNCGSLLQAYALKKALENYGEVEIINFSSKESHAMYDVPHYRGLKRITKYPLVRRLSKAAKDYDCFRSDYLGLTQREFFQEDLTSIARNYDVVVVGSDQVWNVRMSDFNEAFFLGWTDSKKVAYAPSLGGNDLRLSDNFNNIKRWLNDFAHLSVREEIGKRCLEEVTGRVVPKVLDPTLIIDESYWNQLVGESLIKGDYIFYYSWAYCESDTSAIVSEVSKEFNMPVYVIDPRKWIFRNPNKWGFKLLGETGPLVFLNLMKYAKKCYLESFHGMMFAYIFKKDFWLLDIHENMSELDSRLMELVNLFSTHDRILTKYNVTTINRHESMEYGDNPMLCSFKSQSWRYLEQAFCGIES